MRIFTIPTNRPCLEGAVSYVEDIKRIEKKYSEEFKFLILGNGPDAVEDKNIEDFKNWNRTSDFEISYIPKKIQKEWVKKLIEMSNSDKKEDLKRILEPEETIINYGAILNKTFLIAEALNAKSIHRRDSDTKNPKSFEKFSPLEYEIKYLGKRYCDCKELDFDSDKEIYFAGGNYSGEWAGDFSALYKKDPKLLYRHVALNFPGRPLSEIEELSEKRYGNINKENVKEVPVKLVMDRMIELGNCGFYKIYKKYPVSPASQTMATDYFIHDLMFNSNLPNVYHNVRVEHFHTKERENDEWFYNYHLRSARYKVYNRFMIRFFKAYKKSYNNKEFLSGKELSQIMKNEFKNWNYEEEGKYVLKELASIFIDSEIPEYVELSKRISANLDMLLNDTVNGVKDFIILLDNWEDLINTARKIKFEY